jgi:hypothetical protein
MLKTSTMKKRRSLLLAHIYPPVADKYGGFLNG